MALGFSTLLTSDGLDRLVVTDAKGQEQSVVTAASATGLGEVTPNDTLARSQELLLRARRALMGRDTASAVKFVNEATALNAVYSDASDRPEYVLPLVNSYKEIEEAARTHGFTESVRRDLAKNYLHQAEALRRCRDYDSAEALVLEAKKLNIVLDAKTLQSGMDAESVQQRIQDDRMAAHAALAATTAVAPLENISEGMRRQVVQVQQQLAQGRQLLQAGQMDQAEKLGRDMAALGIPENAFVGGDSPARLLGDIAVTRSGSARTEEVNAGAIRQVQGTELLPSLGQSNGYLYIQEAEAALRAGNNDAALKNFKDALRYAAEMDAQAVRHINESIAKLSTAPAAPEVKQEVAGTGINFDQAPQQIQSEISAFITKTHQVRNTNPEEALAMLEKLRDELAASSLEAGVKGHFSYSIDMAINETNRFIAENGALIKLDNQNKDVEEQVRLNREADLQIQNRLAEDTETFNQLLEEGKYDEAIILAKKCQDYSQNDVVSIQMFHKARTAKQVAFNNNLKEQREAGWLQGMNDVESASVINVSDESPVNFGPLWDRVKNRTAIDTGATRSEADMEILNKLNMQITLPFDQPMPLATVMEFIQSSTDMNILIDNAALAEAGITSDMTVETKLSNITLKNYLKHILEPYNLTYIVDDEVLKITNKNKVNGKIKSVVYSVADLVCPIPNFNGTESPWAMESSFNRAFNMVNNRGNNRSAAATISGLGNNPLGANTMISPDVVAQIASAGGNTPFGKNQDSATGGMSDPSELINLIVSVVDPESWEEVGEPQYFNLSQSLIIRQTEENHEEICDLLEKIRSMLDLQIAVEVRFITISDEYFERIGVNFNVSFQSDAPAAEDGGRLTPAGKGIYGLAVSDAAGDKPFTDNLNIDFSQNSYGLAIPQFGNYDPSVGAQMGFAILSDIESYFFMNAAESDRRSNILQAPKVVMFNGQWAYVRDDMEVPYVYTVIPVVGEFAVAQQPVVTVINEGQFMTVQAVASQDRRFVRMTVAPYFSEITEPDRTFKFEGTDTVSTDRTTASKGSDSTSSITDEREDTEAVEYVSTGTTIQQPIISTFSVQTTVKVPDGGTVLLGGIKRLNEGRNEGGVPILSKIPYLKRLFSNSAIGRETTSLMMLVTPRIIIQEEEESFVFGTGNAN